MAVKNLQTVAMRVANLSGVRVAGTESMDLKRAFGMFPTPLSMPRQSLSGSYPIPTWPKAELCAEDAATAQAVHRTGRSAREVRARSSSN